MGDLTPKHIAEVANMVGYNEPTNMYFTKGYLGEPKKVIPRPTRQDLCDWLSEKHNIIIEVRESVSFDNTVEFVCKVNGKYVNHGKRDEPINRFRVYSDALDAGLIVGLKNINYVGE